MTMLDAEPAEEHELRGHRVPELSRQKISTIAQRFCRVMQLKKSSFSKRNMGLLINTFETKGVNIDVVEDEEWLDCTRATVDPATGMIYMPNKLFIDLEKAKPEAVRIFLHELGHIFLCHKPVLHFSEIKPKEAEDSEWQADCFADAVISHLGLLGDGHLNLSGRERQLEFSNF